MSHTLTAKAKAKVKADSMPEQRHDPSEAIGLVAINNSDSVKTVGESNDGDYAKTAMQHHNGRK